MLKKILHPIAIMVIGLVKSAIVGGLVAYITSSVIDRGDIEDTFAPLSTILFFLPAMFFYHLGCVLKLRQYICDILYFIGFLFSSLFFIAWFIFIILPQACDVEVLYGLFQWFYIFTYTGAAVYLAEVIFRNQKRIRELGYKEVFEKLDWRHISERISKQSQSIFIGVIRSWIIAAIVILVAATGPAFINGLRLEPILITKGLMYSTGLLPAIIFYHIARALKLKWWQCDTLYFVAAVVAGLSFLPSALNMMHCSYIFYEYYLPLYAMAVIALGCVAVYMTEVYFRNRAILKSYEQKK
ncbi:MAG: hypothetical protein ABSG82_08875 [Sedimentisphaerales bacterium]|jgi:hypothetical protein